MELLQWGTISFVILGLIIFTSTKKTIENRLAFIQANIADEESTVRAKSVIWWIVSVTIWGVMSIALIVWSFHNYFG